ncbi:MAG: lactate utilization protein [Sphaerochaetaceae bacterium]|nr:lactate utilization protein [Sphaerochaetaceae bacterium]
MESNLEKIKNIRVSKTIENLGKNGIKGVFVPSKVEALALVKTLLVPGETIGVGGSITLSQLGVIDLLRNGEYHFIDRYEKGISKEEELNRKREAIVADTFITGTNAITETGLLYNVDGTGNRACTFLFGPKRMIVIAGWNKIVPSIQDAIIRVKTIAAPANAVRFGLDTYCAKHGHCMNMDTDTSNLMFPATASCTSTICKSAVVTNRQPEGRMTLIIVGEDLGY